MATEKQARTAENVVRLYNGQRKKGLGQKEAIEKLSKYWEVEPEVIRHTLRSNNVPLKGKPAGSKNGKHAPESDPLDDMDMKPSTEESRETTATGKAAKGKTAEEREFAEFKAWKAAQKPAVFKLAEFKAAMIGLSDKGKMIIDGHCSEYVVKAWLKPEIYGTLNVGQDVLVSITPIDT